jgi:hypothetical protein
VSVVKRAKMSSEFSYLFAHFIQCLSGKVGSLDQDSTAHVQMAYSVIKNRKIDYAKLIYQDLLNKLRLPKATSKRKTKRETGVLYPRFLSAILHEDLSKDDSYPPGNLSYSEIGSNILIQRSFPNEVRLRTVLDTALITSLFRPQQGMSSNLTYQLPHSSTSIATSVTNPSLTSPAIPTLSLKRPNPSSGSSKSPKRLKVSDPKKTTKEVSGKFINQVQILFNSLFYPLSF